MRRELTTSCSPINLFVHGESAVERFESRQFGVAINALASYSPEAQVKCGEFPPAS
jgi:hypothetical protein